MTRADVANPPTAPARALARFAYGFVRDHIDSIAALGRLLRGGYRSSKNDEEERW
jgi:hypothetical protein